ncbi:hypothetical protein ADUPG1_013324 [Aduncisulcus paluster]|uniref:Uncharacterized protein n=1 Tax=Aduncisulcus paluster TaxID=2918883 RepID=A0ABQ5K2H9_9EUKA|nr:hypothetical protein ADUPG1_013324 [Aduncisulcus paluster]
MATKTPPTPLKLAMSDVIVNTSHFTPEIPPHQISHIPQIPTSLLFAGCYGLIRYDLQNHSFTHIPLIVQRRFSSTSSSSISSSSISPGEMVIPSHRLKAVFPVLSPLHSVVTRVCVQIDGEMCLCVIRREINGKMEADIERKGLSGHSYVDVKGDGSLLLPLFTRYTSEKQRTECIAGNACWWENDEFMCVMGDGNVWKCTL